MKKERVDLKNIISLDFQNDLTELRKEKENLENHIVCLKNSHLKELSRKDEIEVQLKNEMQKELATVCSR